MRKWAEGPTKDQRTKCQLVRILNVEGSSDRGERTLKFKIGNRSVEGIPKVQKEKAHAACGQSPAH